MQLELCKSTAVSTTFLYFKNKLPCPGLIIRPFGRFANEFHGIVTNEDSGTGNHPSSNRARACYIFLYIT